MTMRRRELRSRFIRLVVAAAFATVGVIGESASPNPTLALCSGYACDGQSPVTTGCSTGAVTIKSKAVYDTTGGWGGQIATLRLRYSPSCRTVWSQTVLATGPAFLDTVQFDIDPQYVERTDNQPPSSAAQVQDSDFHLGDGQSAYGPMLYLANSDTDGMAAFACTNIWMYEKPGYPDFAGGDYECTASWNGKY